MTNKKETFFSSQRYTYLDAKNLILVSYRVLWVDKQTQIQDAFLWPKTNRDIKEIKTFAINFLSDYFGEKNIARYQSQHISAFGNFLAYIINREIELADSLDDFSVESLVKNGTFGFGNGLAYGEHIITIDLEYKNFVD